MKKTILVVEDEWPMLELLKFKISGSGYEVKTATNGSEFFKQAVNEKPDLMILDLWLPDGIGTNFYENLLRSGFDANIPVIFISALAADQSPKKAVSGGRYALFGKPFDCDELLNEIRTLLADPVPNVSNNVESA
jgi:two-component system phosphate regulon response regulator PhoB